ncbi:hypothetical protein [Thermocrinis minervae]|uniref:Uncharacterized protein n=1 Tax=Thermocrinis minervae TaxID=381751 RepID=A0A1M6Q635_9AQUI|nr:hypothetical protein [Thermocrinis minervae]SHK15583.1 hypothetical protein SAMN05444391_0089 [Thermocrinis minervae]
MDVEKEQEKIYKLYRSIVKVDDLLTVEEGNRQKVEVGQVREWLTPAEEKILVVKEVERDLFIVVPLTSLLTMLLPLNPPVIHHKKHYYAPLPFWVYARRELLEKHSLVLFELKNKQEVEKIYQFADSKKLKGWGKWTDKFIDLFAKRFADLNTSSLFYHVEVQEYQQEEEYPKFIDLTAFKEALEKIKQMDKEAMLSLAASSIGKSIRGENYLGVIEGGKLYIYPTEDLVAGCVEVKILDKVILRGVADYCIEIELPEGIRAEIEVLEKYLSVESCEESHE